MISHDVGYSNEIWRLNEYTNLIPAMTFSPNEISSLSGLTIELLNLCQVDDLHKVCNPQGQGQGTGVKGCIGFDCVLVDEELEVEAACHGEAGIIKLAVHVISTLGE